MAMVLSVKNELEGKPAPNFTVLAYPGGQISLMDYRGKKNVILAFYPKDNTPGCTKEMCAFSEQLAHFEEHQTEVIGVSCDSMEAHEKFAAKFNLKQKLIVDSDGKIASAYGVLKSEKIMANRVLFVIDKAGHVVHVHEGMPNNDELLALLKTLPV